MEVSHDFDLKLNQLTDLSARVDSTKFKSSCRSSAAAASGRTEDRFTIVSVAQGRRLAAGSLHSDRVALRYRISVGTPAEQAELIEILLSAQFAENFGRKLISSEQANPEGLNISQLDFARLGTKSESFPGSEGDESQSLNREAVGKSLELYGVPLWDSRNLESWAGNATPAIKAALVKTFSASSLPTHSETISVSPGSVSVTPSHVWLRFHIHAQVPPIEVSKDPDGSMYRELFHGYSQEMENLGVSSQFQESVLDELDAIGVPAIPGMAFVASPLHDHPDDTHAASLDFRIVGLVALLALIAVCVGTCSCWKQRKVAQQRSKGMQDPRCQKADPRKNEEVDNRVMPFDNHCNLRMCMCGQELSPEAAACGKCGREVGRSANIHVEPAAFCQLRFALHECRQANEFKVTSPTSSSATFCKTARQSARHCRADLPNLVDEYRYARKLDYSDRPRAARHNQYNLGEYEVGQVTSEAFCCRASPASTSTTDLPDNMSSVGSSLSASPHLSTWSSPGQARPTTRRTSLGQSARSPGVLSGSEEFAVIDVSDSESEDSNNIPANLRPPRLQSGFSQDKRTLSNWTSRRLFRRTMVSYFVAEENSLPPDMSKPKEDAALPPRVKTVSSLSTEAKCSSGSVISFEVMEVTDL